MGRAFVNAFNRDDLNGVMAYRTLRGLTQVREAFAAQFRGDFGRIRFLTEDMVVDAPAARASSCTGCVTASTSTGTGRYSLVGLPLV